MTLDVAAEAARLVLRWAVEERRSPGRASEAAPWRGLEPTTRT